MAPPKPSARFLQPGSVRHCDIPAATGRGKPLGYNKTLWNWKRERTNKGGKKLAPLLGADEITTK